MRNLWDILYLLFNLNFSGSLHERRTIRTVIIVLCCKFTERNGRLTDSQRRNRTDGPDVRHGFAGGVQHPVEIRPANHNRERVQLHCQHERQRRSRD